MRAFAASSKRPDHPTCASGFAGLVECVFCGARLSPCKRCQEQPATAAGTTRHLIVAPTSYRLSVLRSIIACQQKPGCPFEQHVHTARHFDLKRFALLSVARLDKVAVGLPVNLVGGVPC